MFVRIGSFLRGVNSGYYTYLLFFLVLVFAFRPTSESFWYVSTWKSFFTLTVLTAIFNAKHHHGVKVAAIVLAIPVFILSWGELLFVSNPLFIFHMFCTIAFLAICTASILRDVILHARVTGETLRGVVCAYFMIAFLFAYIYYLLEYLMPGSFHLIGNEGALSAHSHHTSVMMYFSFVTLLTIGFGDITPLLDLSQTFVILEGIVGQFYIAILVARIVSVYSFYADKALLAKAVKGVLQRKRKS